jgi:hypothetical protein
MGMPSIFVESERHVAVVILDDQEAQQAVRTFIDFRRRHGSTTSPYEPLILVAGAANGAAQAGTLAVNSIPSAFMTAMVVFSVGLPFSLNDR